MNNYERSPQRSKKKRDITLMTLLAFEATPEARKLLDEYNRPKAVSVLDLEQKLAKLYYDTNDKAGLEKRLAEIHPHKNWLLRTLPQTAPQPYGGTATTKLDGIEAEIKSGFDGDEKKCTCSKCAEKKSNCCGMAFSGFDGEQTKASSHKINNIELIALVAVIGIAFYALKNH